ncbi:hypothetical protein [Bradyrhizobium sp. BR 1433]|uniref:hypothetical protein n=1 Tax=Bradyrhizobium sp. BR 1433 TaxID=3447967 RepID=UPI003EE7064B
MSALEAALTEIDRSHQIREFSIAVLKHAKQLRQADQAAFLQKAASHFQLRFVECFEENILAGKSWDYATTCNAISRAGGGEAGIRACERIAARVSQLDNALIKKVGFRAISLLASSFSRHCRMTECCNGTVRLAEFCADQRGAFQELNSQSLASLVNGFSKSAETSSLPSSCDRNRR